MNHTMWGIQGMNTLIDDIHESSYENHESSVLISKHLIDKCLFHSQVP